MLTIEEIKENIECPQFGYDHYGKWGSLRLEQRVAYKHLIDIIEELEEENKELKKIIEEIREHITNNSIYYNTSDGCQWVDQFKVLEIIDKEDKDE